MKETTRVVPRFRGNAFERGAGWSWEIMVTIGPEGASDPIFVGPKADTPPLLNKDTALNEMKRATVELMKVVCEALGHPAPEEVIDMNAGESKTMEEYAKPIRHMGGEL